MLEPWAQFNFDATEAAPWPVWQVDPPQGISALADAIDKLANALVKLDEAGVPYDLEKLCETFDLPLLDVAHRAAWLAAKRPAPVLPATDLHVTVAVLAAAPDDLVGTVASIASNMAPLRATLSGVGRFSGPESDAFHASVNAPGLPALRAELEAHNWRFIDRTHGLDPHVTLAYLEASAPSPHLRVTPCVARLGPHVVALRGPRTPRPQLDRGHLEVRPPVPGTPPPGSVLDASRGGFWVTAGS